MTAVHVTADTTTVLEKEMATKKKPKTTWEKIEPGLYCRSDCKKYYIRFQYGGIEHNKAAGSNLKEARKLLYALQARARLEGIGVKDNNILVQDLYKEYLAFCRQSLKRSTTKSYEECFKRLWPFFPCERVSGLTVAMVTEFIKHRNEIDGVRNGTIRRELTLLKAMLRFGERHGLIALNPLRHLPQEKVRELTKRKR